MKTKIVKKSIEVSEGDVSILIELDEKYIHLQGKRGYNFVFKSESSFTTIERWKKILKTLLKAVEVAGKERLNDTNIASIEPNFPVKNYGSRKVSKSRRT